MQAAPRQQSGSQFYVLIIYAWRSVKALKTLSYPTRRNTNNLIMRDTLLREKTHRIDVEYIYKRASGYIGFRTFLKGALLFRTLFRGVLCTCITKMQLSKSSYLYAYPFPFFCRRPGRISATFRLLGLERKTHYFMKYSRLDHTSIQNATSSCKLLEWNQIIHVIPKTLDLGQHFKSL